VCMVLICFTTAFVSFDHLVEVVCKTSAIILLLSIFLYNYHVFCNGKLKPCKYFNKISVYSLIHLYQYIHLVFYLLWVNILSALCADFISSYSVTPLISIQAKGNAASSCLGILLGL
jgi:hypothetical protein